MIEPKDTLRIRQELVIRIPKKMIKKVFLSVPKWKELNGRGGFVRDRTRASQLGLRGPLPNLDVSPEAKLPYDEHLRILGLLSNDPLIVIGARNVGNNLRIIAYDREKGLLQLFGENADKGHRSYWCLCFMNSGHIEAHRLSFEAGRVSNIDGIAVESNSGSEIIWALSGQPLLWEGHTDDNDILLNTYDLRHFFYIPPGEEQLGMRGRGGEIIEELVTILVGTENANSVKERARELNLSRENNYLHSAIGVSKNGDVVIVQSHGSFELVAGKLSKAGATYAIELDEGGSVSTHFVYQKDSRKSSIADSRILASHYFRRKASALLIFKLVFEEGEEGKKPYVLVEEDASLGL